MQRPLWRNVKDDEDQPVDEAWYHGSDEKVLEHYLRFEIKKTANLEEHVNFGR